MIFLGVDMNRDEALSKIVDAVLSSEYARKQRAERNVKDEIEFYGTPRRAMDFESDNINGFFEQDLEEIVKVPDVWEWLKDRVRDEVDGVWSDSKTLLKRLDKHGYIVSEETVFDMLENLSNTLIKLYEKRLREAWSFMTLEMARKTLPKGVYIAFLDYDGKLATEPHMVSMDLKAEVVWKIEEVPHPRYGESVKVREIHITVEPPIRTRGGMCKTQGIRLRDNEVKAEVFSIQ